MIYASEYPGRDLRASSNEIIQCAVADDWQGALKKAQEHLAAVKAELKHADTAATCLNIGRKTWQRISDEEPLEIREVSKLLGVSHDVIRNWERNGLIRVRRNSYNNYRLFSQRDIERLQIIRMLSHAGYSHMAMLRMFIELDGGNTRDLKKVLDTPRADEDIFTAADHWLTTLNRQEKLAKRVIQLIGEKLHLGNMESKVSSPLTSNDKSVEASIHLLTLHLPTRVVKWK